MMNRIFLFLLLSCLAFSVVDAQTLNTADYEQKLSQKDFRQPKYTLKRKVKFLTPNTKNVLIKYNPVTLSLGALMYFYQSTISQQLATECPYQISCSNFGKQCVQRYGIVKGVSLAADRLTRCNEFLKYDITPFNLDKDFHIIDPLDFYSVKTFPTP